MDEPLGVPCHEAGDTAGQPDRSREQQPETGGQAEQKKDLADRADDLLASLRKARQAAESAWTPGEALGEIIAHLARVESFSATAATAEHVRARTRQLAARLRAALRRAEATGLDLNLGGVFGALERHDVLLGRARTVQAPPVRAARDLVRLEISWLMQPASTGTPSPPRNQPHEMAQRASPSRARDDAPAPGHGPADVPAESADGQRLMRRRWWNAGYVLPHRDNQRGPSEGLDERAVRGLALENARPWGLPQAPAAIACRVPAQCRSCTSPAAQCINNPQHRY